MRGINAIIAAVVGGISIVLGVTITNKVIEAFDGNPPEAFMFLVAFFLPMVLTAGGIMAIMKMLDGNGFDPLPFKDLNGDSLRRVANLNEVKPAPKPKASRKYAPSFAASKYSQARRLRPTTSFAGRYEKLLRDIETLREERGNRLK